MGLVDCSACGHKISSEAKACPECGHPVSTAAVVGTYVPRQPKLRVSQGGLIFGLLLLLPAIYFLFVWLPPRDPGAITTVGDLASRVANNQKQLHPDDVGVLKIIGWVVGGLGILQLMTGTLYWDCHIAFCKACNLNVNAKRRWGILRCERCSSRARK